jgi:hypothetical protein
MVYSTYVLTIKKLFNFIIRIEPNIFYGVIFYNHNCLVLKFIACLYVHMYVDNVIFICTVDTVTVGGITAGYVWLTWNQQSGITFSMNALLAI